MKVVYLLASDNSGKHQYIPRQELASLQKSFGAGKYTCILEWRGIS